RLLMTIPGWWRTVSFTNSPRFSWRTTERLPETVKGLGFPVRLVLTLQVDIRNLRHVRAHDALGLRFLESVISKLHGQQKPGIVPATTRLNQFDSMTNQFP